jgi:hypothetical protein
MDFDPDSILKDDALRKIWAIDDTGIVVFKTKDLNLHIFITPKTDDTLFGTFMHPYIKPKHGSEASVGRGSLGGGVDGLHKG